MAGAGNLTTTLITTKGLFVAADVPVGFPPVGGFSALTFGAVITPWFRLYITEVPPPPPEYVAAAGSRVYAPGEFAASLKYIDPATGLATEPAPEPWLVVPRDKEADYFRKNKIVTIRLVWSNKTMEKMYAIPESRARTIIEVANFVNATLDHISVKVSGIKKKASSALVEVRNVVLRRNRNKY